MVVVVSTEYAAVFAYSVEYYHHEAAEEMPVGRTSTETEIRKTDCINCSRG